jgi:hypothetical protein
MLNNTHTWIASSTAWSLTPAARSGTRSAGRTSVGARVSFSRKPSVARTAGVTGAVRQFSRTAATSLSSFRASDATAP